MDPHDLGKVLALVSALGYGLAPVILRAVFHRRPDVDAALIVGLAVSLPFLLAVLVMSSSSSQQPLTLTAFLIFALGGVIGPATARRWTYRAIALIGAAPASAIAHSSPVVSTVLAVALLGEHVDLFQWTAIVLVVAGVVAISWVLGREGARSGPSAGFVLAMLAALAYGTRPFLLKIGLEEVALPVHAAFIGTCAALVWVYFTSHRPLTIASGRRALAGYAAAGLLQGTAMVALAIGLTMTDISVVSPVTASAPLFTLVFAWLLLPRSVEARAPAIAFGVAAVVVGVALL
jgi:transporter family protein